MCRIMLILLLLLLLLISPRRLTAQGNEIVSSVMFYNVENLFDTDDDPLTADDEFLPKGDRRWSNYRFYAKLCSLAKVIVNTGSWEPPAFIGLCEVENRYVLERLVAVSSLKKWNYQIIHKNSPDERGIDVAAIYRPDVFNPLTYAYFSPVQENEPVPKTREILYVMGIFGGYDTLHVYINHWPSRYGGLMETRSLRQKAALRLASEVASIKKKYHQPLILITGDFNDSPDDFSMTDCLGAQPLTGNDSTGLYNLSYGWSKEGKGTLKHQSAWNVFDQIIVSGSILNGKKPLFSHTGDAIRLNLPFLLTQDERNLGEKLFRTYEGFRYIGGYSDHLPVMLNIRRQE
jgi:hypothetical protein